MRLPVVGKQVFLQKWLKGQGVWWREVFTIYWKFTYFFLSWHLLCSFIPLFSVLIFTSYFFFFRTQDLFLISLLFVALGNIGRAFSELSLSNIFSGECITLYQLWSIKINKKIFLNHRYFRNFSETKLLIYKNMNINVFVTEKINFWKWNKLRSFLYWPISERLSRWLLELYYQDKKEKFYNAMPV